jgi:histone deacetylase 4/5
MHSYGPAVSRIKQNCFSAVEDEEDRSQRNVFVWYACYGSNLLEERFHCYLRGGRVEGMSRDCVGARDNTHPTASLVKWMPYSVFFADACVSAWGYGGGAILDVGTDRSSKSCMRLYKVNLQQFNDIVAQENSRAPPLPPTNWLTCKQLANLRNQAPGSLRLQFENGYYPAVAYLGDHDEVPIVTFTCLTEKVKGLLSGELPAAPPAINYLAVLQRGLQELGMHQIEAENYWSEIIKRQFVV